MVYCPAHPDGWVVSNTEQRARPDQIGQVFQGTGVAVRGRIEYRDDRDQPGYDGPYQPGPNILDENPWPFYRRVLTIVVFIVLVKVGGIALLIGFTALAVVTVYLIFKIFYAIISRIFRITRRL
jgi:hypothetical protein